MVKEVELEGGGGGDGACVYGIYVCMSQRAKCGRRRRRRLHLAHPAKREGDKAGARLRRRKGEGAKENKVKRGAATNISADSR